MTGELKAQTVRLADVFFIGPLMTWGGYKLLREYRLPGVALGALGILTVLYNGSNYLRVESERRQEREEET